MKIAAVVLNLIFSVSITSLFGCASMSGDYSQTTMVRVQHKRSYEPVGSKEFKIEDKNLSITYIPDIVEAGNNIQIMNKSSSIVKIIWDESVYTGPDKNSQKIFHAGVKIADRGQSQPPSIVPPNGTLQDTIVPIESVHFGDSGWVYSPLCGVKSLAMHTLDDSMCVNKEFSFFITYELDGKKSNLTYKYKFLSKEPIKAEK